MNSITMEFFVAELYRNEFESYNELSNRGSDNTVNLENVIRALDSHSCIEDSIGSIMDILKKYYGIEATDRDRFIIREIAYSEGMHNMNYYFSKEEEYRQGLLDVKTEIELKK